MRCAAKDLVFWQEPTRSTNCETCKQPEDGVNVHGFFLQATKASLRGHAHSQGAGWDVKKVKMVESEKARPWSSTLGPLFGP